MQQKTIQKVLSLLLTLTMLLTMLPTAVLASEIEQAAETLPIIEEVVSSETTETEAAPAEESTEVPADESAETEETPASESAETSEEAPEETQETETEETPAEEVTEGTQATESTQTPAEGETTDAQETEEKEETNETAAEDVLSDVAQDSQSDNVTLSSAELAEDTPAVSGTLATGVVTDDGSVENDSYIYFDISGITASKSIEIKLYSGETLLSTTALVKSEYLSYTALSAKVEITDDSSSWDTTWAVEPVANLVPDSATLYIDGYEMNTVESINMYNLDYPANARDWHDVEGVAPAKAGTYEELAAYVAAGYPVVLTADITATGEINGTDAEIDLGGCTLTLTVGGTNFYGESTVSNGTIDITGCVASGDCIIGIGDYSNDATLTLNGVNVTGDGYSSAYAVLYVYGSSTLNVNGGSIVVSNDSAELGGVIKSSSAANGKVNITGTADDPVELTFTDAKIGILDGTVVMDYVDLDITGGANAINQSALTVKNSTLTITGADGRALTLSQGNVTIENSTLDFSGCAEGEIRFKQGLSLTTDSATTITACTTYRDSSAEGANVNGGAIAGTEDSKDLVTVENGVTTVKAAPTGSITPVYTRADGFWGEGGGNASESLVIELYEGETKIATSTLNNIGGIINGSVYVTWSIPFAGSADEYWTVEWAEGYPKYDMAPTKGVMVIDGTAVAESAVQFNAPDSLNKIVALAEGFTGGVIAYTSLVDAMGSFNGRKVNVLRDVSEDIEEMSGVTLTTNVPGGVTITNTVDDYIYAMDSTIGKGVTVVTSGMFYQGDENNVYGRLEVDNDQFNSGAIYYQGYDAIVNVKDGGSVDVEGSVIFRYNENVGALNIYGDGDDSTVEFACDYYIGAYSGTFYAENANIETGYFLLKNSYDDSSYADIDMTLDNSTLTVAGTTDGQDSFIIDDQASLTLQNGSAIADVRDFSILSGANLTLAVDASSSISATNVSIADDVPLVAGKNEDGTLSIGAPAAEVGGKYYVSFADAVAAAVDGDTITLLSDAANPEATIAANVTVDLGGYTLTDSYIIVTGEVTIKNGSIKNTEESYPLVVQSGGELTLEDVAIEASKSDRAVWVRENSTLNLGEGSSILATKGENNTKTSLITGVYVASNTQVNVNGGTITVDTPNNKAVGIYGNYENANVTMTAGKISTSGKGYNYGINVNGDVTVSGGEIVTNEKGYGYSSGIRYGFNYGIVTELGDVTISGGTITTNGYSGYAVNVGRSYNAVDQTVTITGGTFSNDLSEVEMTTGGHSAPAMIWEGSAATVTATITDGTFSGYSATLLKGDSSTLVVSGGTYDVEVDKAFLAEGYKMEDNGDGTYGAVVDLAYGKEAQIGETYYATLAEALDAAKGETNIVIDLVNDATLDITAWQTLAIGGETTETITINGNGNTLTFNKLDSDWDHVATNNNAKLILNDMTLSDSGYNDGPWNRYDHNFACDVELNNVTSNKALAFKADAKLTNVTINETGDNYAIWIQPNGQSVEIDGLTVNSAGRGIKIDEQYVDEAAKVTLSVANAAFTTAKKAAILVKSSAGADITASNVNIENVAADNVNLVWVDEDGAATYGAVTVTGGTAAQEGVTNFVATATANGVFGYYKTIAEAAAAADEGSTVTVIADAADETVTVTKNLTITGTVTLNNVSITGSGAEVDLTVSGLTFTGNSWINSGDIASLTVSGVTANVAPSNASATNSRSAFIALGRSEQNKLALTVTDSEMVVTGGGDPILGWAAITEATITGNTFGSAENYQTNSDSAKFMSIADGATFTITGNTVYSNYNGFVFAQNTTRDNAYSVIVEDNDFYGSADHIWVEVSGASTTHATVNATSDNTVNGAAFTASDIKTSVSTWTSYAGVDVVTNNEGKVIGGQLAFYAADAIAEGYEVDGSGNVVRNAAGEIMYFVYVPAATGEVGTASYRESIKVDIKNVYAEESLVVELYSGETKISTTTLRQTDRDDETAKLYPIEGTTTANIIVSGKLAGSWDTEWHETPAMNLMPTGIKVYADGKLVDEMTGELGDNYKAIYSAFTGVYKEAQIGETYYATLAEAFTAAQAGDEVKILAAGTYALSTSGKDITITGAVDGVVFANIGAKNMNGANVTFNNVTFEYATNSTYKGLQHAGDLVYNNCTINGQVFLYGARETFNSCTFNTTDADNYNVWTYGAKEVTFSGCTFNSAGKSVLIYAEGASITNDVTVTDCDFIASAPVDGKAAIEMDSSLTAGITLSVDADTTVTGFGSGSVSGNSLWNNKKGSETLANNDITVVVAGETVLEPWIPEASIGETVYKTLQEAFAAAQAGDTVKLLADVTLTEAMTIEKAITLDLNTKTVTGADGAIVFNVKAETTIKNGAITGNKSGTSSGLIDIYADLTMDGVSVETSAINALRFKAGACTATLTDCQITGDLKGYGSSVWNIQSGVYQCSTTATSDHINGSAAVSGGTFHYAIDEADCASGYVVVDNGDGTYTVKYAPACFVDANGNGVLDEGEAVYGNLDQVFANHTEGTVNVVLTADIAANAQVDTDVDAIYNFTTNVDGGVTMDFLFADDWNYVQKMTIGENITLNAPYLLAWTTLEISGTVNTGYAYFTGANVTVTETGVLNANTGDATVQVKNGATLTVNGEVNTGTLNVWAGESKLNVSGETAKLTASWIDIWDGTPSVVVENGATLTTDSIKASRGGEITVDAATLDAENVELGHNGESTGALSVVNNGTITGETKLTAVGSTLTGPEGMNVTTDVADHKVVYENGAYTVVAAEYVAEVSGVKYETLQSAIDAAYASGGGTVTLVSKNGETITEDTVVVKPGVTLDLAGQKLASSYLIGYNGSQITDSAETKGAILCERKGIMLTGDNKALPVWNGTDGYLFETVSVVQALGRPSTTAEGTYEFISLPEFETIEDILGADGGEAHGVSIEVYLSWDEESFADKRTLAYTDAHIQEVYASGGEKAFYAYITNYAGYTAKNLMVQVAVVSELGVEILSETTDIK